MTEKRGSYKTSLGIMIGAFLLVVIGGRFLIRAVDSQKSQNKRLSEPTTIIQDSASKTDATSQAKPTEPAAKTTSAQVPESPLISCVNDLKQTLEKNKQSYAKGQILVTFNSTVTYKSAKDVLAIYGLMVQNEAEAAASFASSKYLTAAVTPGQELTKICMLRSDSNIKYAGPDIYINLHQ